MPSNRMQLSDDERKVLRTLARRGAMSPSLLSVETWLLPGQTLRMLKELADVGMVLLRDDPGSADGQMVAITTQARDLLAKGF